ncbi:MAG: hypothetical protein QNL49_01055 [Actinomycetota bacterium]
MDNQNEFEEELDYYHDDPDQEANDKPDRKKIIVIGFSASVVLIVSAIFYLPTSIGGSIAVDAGANKEFGQAISQVVACSGDNSLTVELGREFINSPDGGEHYLNVLTVSDIPESCVGSDFTISAYGPTSSTPLELFTACTNATEAVVSYADTLFEAKKNVSGISVVGNFDYEWKEHVVGGGGQNWTSIDSSDDGTKIAASAYGGYIYTSTDSGNSWTAHEGIGRKNWNTITISSDGTKIAAAADGSYVYASQDSGANWSELSDVGSRRWTSLSSSADGTNLVGTTWAGYPLFFSNLGTGLSRAGIDGTTRDWLSSGMSADGMVMAVGQASSIWGTHNGITVSGIFASGFSHRGTAKARVLTLSSDGNIGLSGDTTLWRSVDKGVTWQQISITTGTWRAVAASATGKYLYAGSIKAGSKYIYTSGDYGLTWTPQTALGEANWAALATSKDGTKLFAGAGNGGNIYTAELSTSFTATFTSPLLTAGSINKVTLNTNVSVEQAIKVNRTWTKISTAGVRKWTSIASSCTGEKLAAVVQNGYIYTSINSGSIWTEHDSLGIKNWKSITSSRDGTVLVAAINNGLIYRSTNSGTDWLPMTSAGSKNWISIAMSEDGMTIAAAEYPSSGIWVSKNGGDDWVRKFITNAAWRSIAISSNGVSAVATSFGGTYITSDLLADVVSWTKKNGGNWSAVASSSDGKYLAAARVDKDSNTHVYTSSDYGVTFVKQNSSRPGTKFYQALAFSADGSILTGAAWGDYIYTSIDSGVTWVKQTLAGSRNWSSVATSADGTKIVAVAYDGEIWTSEAW